MHVRQMKVTVMLVEALRYVTLRQQHDRPRDMTSRSLDACHHTTTTTTLTDNRTETTREHAFFSCDLDLHPMILIYEYDQESLILRRCTCITKINYPV